ncbi:hypothetical protein [Kitasatospora paracochleata]|uniref:Tetratricopeptide repeat protein n=1 Tax=Kitasatospora paracochleata TaxID=58354 RepID=A0ABT1IQM0_9ACTN|nr:hypothetical protein [Kitasatospora paracochleata]MCP2307392.1 hypothetical protein [Kitasatospora paracochleata]
MKKSPRRYLRILLFLLVIVLAVVNATDGRPSDGSHPLAFLVGGLGPIAGLQLGQLVTLAVGRAGGYALLGLSLGLGPRLREWRIGGMPFTVRRVPVPFLAGSWVIADRPGLRARLWLATAASTGVQLALGLWLVVAGSGAGRYFGLGLLLLPALMLTWFAKVPLSAGWVLLRLPFLPADALAPFAATGDELATTRALRAGRIAEAAALPVPGTGFQGRHLRACLALARGEYESALAEAGRATTLAPHSRHGAPAQLLLAAALVGAAETGLLPPADYLPRLARAVETARTAQPALARASAAAADLALLEGRREEALALARQAVGNAPDRLWLAVAECSHALALASLARTADARAALDRARAAAPDLARIAWVARRIELNVIEA